MLDLLTSPTLLTCPPCGGSHSTDDCPLIRHTNHPGCDCFACEAATRKLIAALLPPPIHKARRLIAQAIVAGCPIEARIVRDETLAQLETWLTLTPDEAEALLANEKAGRERTRELLAETEPWTLSPEKEATL